MLTLVHSVQHYSIADPQPRNPTMSPRPILSRTLLACVAVVACSDEPVRPSSDATVAATVGPLAFPNPPGASVQVAVQVPASMRSSPFDVQRYLTVPPNFAVAVFSRVANARFLAVAPNGDVFVSVPSAGRVYLLRPRTGADPLLYTYASGLRKPHDLVFHTIGGTTYLYVAESHQINRYVYTNGSTSGTGRQVVVAGLPDASTPGLGGQYGHQLKNIALSGNQLLVSVASTCNACTSDRYATPERAAIHMYNADGTGGRIFARGLRNAEGLALTPGASTLWVVVNGRDNTPYPHNDQSGNYGQVIQSYVDNHPPEIFTSVRDGGDYGWPYCNPTGDSPSGYNDMPYDNDYDHNRLGTVSCAAMDRSVKGLEAHSAPLGLTFLGGTNFPSIYQPGAVIALHGSWNRSSRNGTKLVYFPWDGVTQRPGNEMDLATGWLQGQTRWGRPVDMAVAPNGDLYISDDYSGTIYRMSYASSDQPPVARFYTRCFATNHKCNFFSEQSSDDNGIVARDWTFGDGATRSGNKIYPTHYYAAAGNYTVTLRVTDTAGQTGTRTRVIVVP